MKMQPHWHRAVKARCGKERRVGRLLGHAERKVRSARVRVLMLVECPAQVSLAARRCSPVNGQ